METLASNISDILYHSGNQNIIGPVDAISLSCDKFESNVTRIDRVSGGKRKLTKFTNIYQMFCLS